MATILTPATMQQLKESSLVEVASDDDDLSPIREISHDDDEQNMEVNNPMMSSVKEFDDKSSPCIFEQNPSYTGDSSPAQSEMNL